ncbi:MULTISPECIES: hypothetical protein [Streptomyces]|uniref:Hydrogenase maturation protease n=1 Tax=Streptomyces luteosporeus TaxID=173856 RepID=A0ABN3U0I0_9ACTN
MTAPAAAARTVARAVEEITRTCLYEGYLLWPYRRSALKNTRRWTFGAVFPTACAAALGERNRMRTEVLLEAAGAVRVRGRVRFLHAVDRQVHRRLPDGGREPVDALTVAGTRHLTWQEATEREWPLPPWSPGDGPLRVPVEVPGGRCEEVLTGADGQPEGSLVRSWQPLAGELEVAAVPLGGGAWRFGVTLHNTSPCPPVVPGRRTARDELARHAFLSTHAVLECAGEGAFVSLAAPPAGPLAQAARECRNEGVWPALVAGPDGPPDGDRHRCAAVLASPVTLEDFPSVAPESPGPMFDGGEIDQLLVLSVLALTPEEQQEARASDPRAREILDRCAALSPRELMALHGALRGVAPAAPAPSREAV